jgi:hypothetical protein
MLTAESLASTAGYEDVNDHHQLRLYLAFQIAAGRTPPEMN